MVKEYPKIFKEDKTGKKRFWHVRIYQDDQGKYKLFIDKGVVGGKITTDIVIIIPKANRTANEQAIQEANRRYKDKIRQNYRPEGAKQELSLRPYLLKTYESSKEKLKFPAYIQPKLDGIRSLFGLVKTDKGKYRPQFISRRCVVFPNPLTGLKKEFVKSDFPKNPKIFLDGEIYVHDPSLKEKDINGILQTQPSSKSYKVNKELTKKLEFHVFDYFDLRKLDMPFSKRYENLKKMFAKTKGKLIRFKLVPQEIVHNEKEINERTDHYISKGYEGSVVRNGNFTYDIRGNRICDVLKVKRWHEEEFKIIGADQSKYGEVIWILEYVDNKGKKDKFKAVFADISREERQQYYKDRKKYLNKLATVKYQEKINNKPRFGVVIKIREDL